MNDKIKCSECGSLNVVNNGIRETKKGSVQKYKCKDCCRIFSLSSSKNKSYNASVILDSIGHYNLGNTFSDTSSYVNKKYKVKTYPQTICNWVKENKELCSFGRFRDKINGLDNYDGSKIIYSKLFDHKQPYLFMYNKFKVDNLINDYFNGLKSYLVDAVERCPKELFVSDNVRSSKFRIDDKIVKRVKVIKSKNYACKLSSLALKSCCFNKERHSTVQKFMLLNDSVTVACEVPVWMTKEEINKDLIISSILNIDSDVTGHIDVVQSKFGFIHILDYKPKASYENISKVISQLFLYAVMISFRTGIWLRNIRCAWFDSESYFEFNPNLIVIDHLKRNNITDNGVWQKYWTDYRKHEFAVKKNMIFKKNIDTKGNISKVKSVINRVLDKIFGINRLLSSTADWMRFINRVLDRFLTGLSNVLSTADWMRFINRGLDKIFDIVMLAFCIFSGKKQDFDVFDVKEGLNAA